MPTSFHYWLTDIELPLEAQAMIAASLTVDAASQADITKGAIAKALAALAKEGGRLTQVAIARAASVSQGWVSRFFATMGGWQVWRAIITSLIKGSNRTSNNLDLVPESLTDDERWIAQEYLSLVVAEYEADPVGVVESVANLALGYGAEAWRRILAGAERVVVAELLGLMERGQYRSKHKRSLVRERFAQAQENDLSLSEWWRIWRSLMRLMYGIRCARLSLGGG